MPEVTVIYGGPGAGKTTALLGVMERELEVVDRTELAFCSFTRQASYGARDRAIAKFGGSEDDYPFFRTLHSLAYRALPIGEGSIMQPTHYRDIAEALNLRKGLHQPTLDGPVSWRPEASTLLSLTELARNRIVGLEDIWHELKQPGQGWYLLKRYHDTLRAYQRDTGMLDFTGLLEQYLADGAPLPVDVAIVDEAQDLTPLQWRVVWHAFSEAERLYIAGDDDQAIFRWAGADVEAFQRLEGTRRVLDRSHRLPARLFRASQTVVNNIRKRTPKAWGYARDGGDISWHRRVESVPDMGSDTWLLLARNRYLLDVYTAAAQRRGVYFQGPDGPSVAGRDIDAIRTWEALRQGRSVHVDYVVEALAAAGKPPMGPDITGKVDRDFLGLDDMAIWHEAFVRMPRRRRVYIVECLRRGEDLTKAPRVRIDTIHGAKGAEADHVVLMLDITTRTREGMRRSPDDEWRCLYVGMTRASRHLHMITPSTPNHYRITRRTFS